MTNLQGKPFTLSQPIHPWALNRDVVKKDIMKSYALLKLSCSELRPAICDNHLGRPKDKNPKLVEEFTHGTRNLVCQQLRNLITRNRIYSIYHP
jgi:hypothetical protein